MSDLKLFEKEQRSGAAIRVAKIVFQHVSHVRSMDGVNVCFAKQTFEPGQITAATRFIAHAPIHLVISVSQVGRKRDHFGIPGIMRILARSSKTAFKLSLESTKPCHPSFLLLFILSIKGPALANVPSKKPNTRSVSVNSF